MPKHVTDTRSNAPDQIAFAAKELSRSRDRRRVFEAIYKGKKKVKTVAEIASITGLDRIRVLQEGGRLSGLGIVTQTKFNKDTAYEKDPFYIQKKKRVLSLARNKKALSEFHTKTNPKLGEVHISVSLPKKMARAKQLTIDGIDSFAKVRGIVVEDEPRPVYERKIKESLLKILREEGSFQDWGGETDDLFSTRLVLNGERKNVAFGLKGCGTSGKLTPKKMGKNGDQIQRLFNSPADVFLVQYWGQIDESVINQMKQFAIAKSVVEDRNIYYGIIDGEDTTRLLRGYPEQFQ
jgi:hypothetical protein